MDGTAKDIMMKIAGWLLLALGLFFVIVSFSFNTSNLGADGQRIVDAGRAQTQMMVFAGGCVLGLIGAIFVVAAGRLRRP